MITIITAWYNESFLANLFLSHYQFADAIIVMIDENNSDQTLGIIKKFDNVIVKKLSMPHGMDDALKQAQINYQYTEINTGWVIIADADEFIQIPAAGINTFLDSVTDHTVKIDYFQMYQHKSESALDQITPVFEQRRHGMRNGLERWKKPAIARAGKNLLWSVGHHENNAKAHHQMLKGAHWAMADANLAIERRINGRKNRMSPLNFARGFSNHNFKITKKQIIDQCLANNNLEKVF